MNSEAVRFLFAVLRSAVGGDAVTDSERALYTPEILPELIIISKKHDVLHLLAYGLKKNGLLDGGEIGKKLESAVFAAAYRCEKQKYELDAICETLESASIRFITLKGSVLRSYYPEPWMRTSCDIDILIHESDVDNAVKLFLSREYRIEGRNYHDVSLFSPSGVHLELHFNILENTDNLDAVLKDVWQYAAPVSNGARYELSTAFFVFHIYAHTAYHFLAGGCGIRAMIDLWIMKKRMGVELSCAEKFLETAQIKKFALEMSALAEECFSINREDVFSDIILRYILNGGVYGNAGNGVAVKKSESKNIIVYSFNRLFPSYKNMTAAYPVLKKAPYLLPFCWIRRLIIAVIGKKKKIALELSNANSVSSSKIEEINEIRTRLGI